MAAMAAAAAAAAASIHKPTIDEVMDQLTSRIHSHSRCLREGKENLRVAVDGRPKSRHEVLLGYLEADNIIHHGVAIERIITTLSTRPQGHAILVEFKRQWQDYVAVLFEANHKEIVDQAVITPGAFEATMSTITFATAFDNYYWNKLKRSAERQRAQFDLLCEVWPMTGVAVTSATAAISGQKRKWTAAAMPANTDSDAKLRFIMNHWKTMQRCVVWDILVNDGNGGRRVRTWMTEAHDLANNALAYANLSWPVPSTDESAALFLTECCAWLAPTWPDKHKDLRSQAKEIRERFMSAIDASTASARPEQIYETCKDELKRIINETKTLGTEELKAEARRALLGAYVTLRTKQILARYIDNAHQILARYSEAKGTIAMLPGIMRPVAQKLHETTERIKAHCDGQEAVLKTVQTKLESSYEEWSRAYHRIWKAGILRDVTKYHMDLLEHVIAAYAPPAAAAPAAASKRTSKDIFQALRIDAVLVGTATMDQLHTYEVAGLRDYMNLNAPNRKMVVDVLSSAAQLSSDLLMTVVRGSKRFSQKAESAIAGFEGSMDSDSHEIRVHPDIYMEVRSVAMRAVRQIESILGMIDPDVGARYQAGCEWIRFVCEPTSFVTRRDMAAHSLVDFLRRMEPVVRLCITLETVKNSE